MQTTSHVFLVKPASFYFNSETAASNAFQNRVTENEANIQQKAFAEFDRFADALSKKGVQVIVFNDTEDPKKPDAVFPNNWISLHENGLMVLYPMCAPNRRLERRQDIIEVLKKEYKVTRLLDLSVHEKENKFLEGTGSIVFDHVHKTAYACLSVRTDRELFLHLCQELHYTPITFFAHDQYKKEIYHTNVMMCIADTFAVICLESITSEEERTNVLRALDSSGHQVIAISFEQMNQFAGNMLALKTTTGKAILVLSQSAFTALNHDQKQAIATHCQPLPLNITTIETIGGGSARCMIAEIFTPIR